MIYLSYSTINELLTYPHSWINKQMGIKKPDKKAFFEEGKRVHRVVQDHLCGKVHDERVALVTDKKFPIVEQEEFDKNCKIEVKISREYLYMGYFDGWNPEIGEILEIKTSVKETGLWSLQKYKDSYQRKGYGLGLPSATQSFLITAIQDMDLWDRVKPKTRSLPITQADRDDAMAWIEKAIKFLEAGDFTGDLDNGRCNHYMCPYGENCYFK